ncbi:unannotated protein [freshwater metagenome]|uniref:Unannotated protein n=1 Tax=freshwater metagenome TaxID=449393 RepID=A0A6J6IZ73_9ZZZZ|nr:imidazole glycerol phosphate synthase subunit HisH [Actinomycetota bacterium]
MSAVVVVLDYGYEFDDLLIAALESSGAQVEVSADSAKVQAADGLVIVGQEDFQSVMKSLKKVRAPDLVDRRLAGGKAVLGISAGIQIMFEELFDDDILTEGLGQWPGAVQKLKSSQFQDSPWRGVSAAVDSKLFHGIENELFYFANSCAATEFPLQVEPPFIAPLLTFSNYGEKHIAAVENGPLTGVQFHPEKSGDAGIALLRNWLAAF